MDNAGYIALSRQRGLFRQMDVVANNVANAESTGYKADGMLFEQFLMGESAKQKLSFTNDVSTYKDMQQGAMTVTHRDLDLAINGDGYFEVNTPLGPRYTRAGNFVTRADGTVVTTQGYELVGEGGQAIVIQEEDDRIVVREDGTITVGALNDERGKIQLVRFENPQLLEKTQSGLFKTEAQALPVTEQDAKIMQGMIEKSNVSPVVEMTRMIKVSRSVGGITNVMKDLHEMQLRTIQTYGRQQ